MKRTRVLAISSAGGHWEQLMLIRAGLDECEVVYAVTNVAVAERSGVAALAIPDFNAKSPLKTAVGSLKIAALVLRVRPDVVLSTGAAPGLVAAVVAKLMGKRAVWIDSIANLWLTQWRHLAADGGPRYGGAVL